MLIRSNVLSACALLSLLAAPLRADDLDAQLKQVQSVGPRGAGHTQAAAALKQIEQTPPAQLVRILVALDNATPLTANWLRGAFESAAGNALRKNEPLPVAELEAFVADRSHSSLARRCGYEWLAKADPTAPDRIIPGALDDPSSEMRRDAVALLIKAAKQAEEAGQRDEALATYRRALTGATDGDQVEALAQALQTLEQPVDLVRHFALVTDWQIIGPFNNKDGVGYAAVYPPENEVKLDAEYEGSLGPVKWAPLSAEPKPDVIDVNEIGKFDIAKLTGPHKGAVSYATCEFISEADQPVEFRLATPNAWKLWVNGQPVFGQEEYHRGMMFDQYVARGTLQRGANRILLKFCQNEMTQDWAQEWAFQFRVCDLAGKGIVAAETRTAAK